MLGPEECGLVRNTVFSSTQAYLAWSATPPGEAHLETCDTPKHGSLLNIAETKLSAMTRLCLSDRRIGDLPPSQDEIPTWTSDVNDCHRGVDWQMVVCDSYKALNSIYPTDLR